MDKKKILHYISVALFFIILAAVVSFCAIWIKYKVMDYEVMNRQPEHRDYSPYYNSLNYKDQMLYDSVLSAAVGLLEESEVLSYSYEMDDFQRVIHHLRADRPELFYLDFDNLVLYHSRHKTKVGMVYHGDADSIKEMRDTYSRAVAEAIEGISPDMTDFEKEVAVNDYIADNCSHAVGKTDALASTAYGALVNGSAYCDGYAYAAKQLLNEVYIESYVVYGTAEGAEHVWNIAEIDGKSYHLDVMWNDADIKTDTVLRFHGYFNLSDEEILLDHSFDNENQLLPACTFKDNYYKQISAYAETADQLEEVFVNSLTKAVEEGKSYIELYCPETKENDDISTPFTDALKRVNESLGYDALYSAFSIYEASAQNNSVTIQIFYN